jgi:hypothetical protein
MSVRLLKLIAPFRCQFNLDSAKTVEEGAKFNAFLKELDRDFHTTRERLFPGVPAGVNIEILPRQDAADADSRYISIDQAGSFLDFPQYFSIKFSETFQQDVKSFLTKAKWDADTLCRSTLSEKLSPLYESIDIAIYNNTIAILTLDVAIEKEFGNDDWLKLDEWTTRLVFYFLRRIYKEFLHSALSAVNHYAAQRSEKSIINPRDYAVFYDISSETPDADRSRLLWVNRTLICPKGEATHDWARHRMDDARIIEVDRAHVHLSSGNNVIETTSTSVVHNLSPVWQGMYLAQYHYAVLDVIGKNIKHFIGLNYDKKSNRELRALTASMDTVIDTIIVFQVQYRDMPTELQGLTKSVFRRLEKEWDMESLFSSVQKKRELCESNLARVNGYINHRNSARVQMVLAVLAGLGLVSLMVAISSYGRALLKDGLDGDAVGLLALAQVLTPGTMIWIGVILAIAVSVLISANRPR